MKELFIALMAPLLFAAVPQTTNYQLNSYGFGSGGTVNSSTATYSLEGATGELTDSASSTANTTTKPGYVETKQANVPKLVSLDNNGGEFYNKLQFVIDQQGNPSDAKYLVAVSTDDFTSDTKYLRPDGTLSDSVSTSYYQTYNAWGGANGSLIIGLEPDITYSVKLKATQGDSTESQFGPSLSETTGTPSLTFGLETSTQSSPPFSVSLGTLNAGDINTTDSTINTSLTTNGASGADVYILGKNGALKSDSTGSQISAVSDDLANLTRGFGVQSTSVGQASGGPYTVQSPYDVTGTYVGIVSAINRSLYSSSSPVTDGSGVLVLKAKSATDDVAASDYREVLTFIAAGNF